MRAVVVDRFVEPAELAVREAPEPEAAPGTVVVDVRAAGCNFFDGLQVQGKYQERLTFPFVPGAECAGVVRAIGPGVAGVAVGDRVMAGLVYGAFAERIAIPAARVMPMPDGMSFEEAAAFPVAFLTSYGALVMRAGLRAGETVLVTAAAGGVGLAAVQIAKALGARVVAAAGGEEHVRVAREAGADVGVDYRDPGWGARVMEATGGRGVDVVVESVGGDTFHAAMKCLAWSGRIVVVGFAGGAIPEIAANRVLLKNVSVLGLFVGTYAKQDPARLAEAQRELVRLRQEGKLAARVSRTLPLEKTGEALAALLARATWGTLVVTP
jgi:NADPH2:quinone reductase